MPSGAIWQTEFAPPLQLARLATGLFREFSADAGLLLRRAALHRALRVVSYVRRERPDILFANLAPAEYAAFFARRLVSPRTFPPIVPVVRNVVKRGTNHTKRRKMLFPEAAHVVAVSRGVAENVSESLDVPAEKIESVYNPVLSPDIARRAKETAPHPWFKGDGPPVILGTGRLVPQKDFLTLIQAFRWISEQRPCRLVILGEGPMRDELEDRVRRLELEDCVSLPGWVENPYAFMSRAALFVLSSRHEGFPGALVEALACGCPAVSTDCPAGPSEILEHRDLLAPVGDAKALSRVILSALDRPVPEAALRAIAARFTVERATDGYELLITRILARQSASQLP